MTSSAHKVALTAHVISSVGWFGAVASFLALAIAGLISHDAQTIRGAYLAMELTGWFARNERTHVARHLAPLAQRRWPGLSGTRPGRREGGTG